MEKWGEHAFRGLRDRGARVGLLGRETKAKGDGIQDPGENYCLKTYLKSRPSRSHKKERTGSGRRSHQKRANHRSEGMSPEKKTKKGNVQQQGPVGKM